MVLNSAQFSQCLHGNPPSNLHLLESLWRYWLSINAIYFTMYQAPVCTTGHFNSIHYCHTVTCPTVSGYLRREWKASWMWAAPHWSPRTQGRKRFCFVTLWWRNPSINEATFALLSEGYISASILSFDGRRHVSIWSKLAHDEGRSRISIWPVVTQLCSTLPE